MAVFMFKTNQLQIKGSVFGGHNYARGKVYRTVKAHKLSKHRTSLCGRYCMASLKRANRAIINGQARKSVYRTCSQYLRKSCKLMLIFTLKGTANSRLCKKTKFAESPRKKSTQGLSYYHLMITYLHILNLGETYMAELTATSRRTADLYPINLFLQILTKY